MELENEVEEVAEGEPRKVWQIYPASPKVLEKCDKEKLGVGLTNRPQMKPQAKYPFAELLVGECFTIPFAELDPTSIVNLRGAARSAGKLQSKKFTVVVHKEYQCVEVARIA